MTITYSFKILSINKLSSYVDEENNTYTDVITKINYKYVGIDDDNSTSIFYGFITLPKPTSTDYKSYNSLIESDIISWLESLITTDDLTLMKTVITNNIEDSKTKTSSLPWSS